MRPQGAAMSTSSAFIQILAYIVHVMVGLLKTIQVSTLAESRDEMM